MGVENFIKFVIKTSNFISFNYKFYKNLQTPFSCILHLTIPPSLP